MAAAGVPVSSALHVGSFRSSAAIEHSASERRGREGRTAGRTHHLGREEGGRAGATGPSNADESAMVREEGGCGATAPPNADESAMVREEGGRGATAPPNADESAMVREEGGCRATGPPNARHAGTTAARVRSESNTIVQALECAGPGKQLLAKVICELALRAVKRWAGAPRCNEGWERCRQEQRERHFGKS